MTPLDEALMNALGTADFWRDVATDEWSNAFLAALRADGYDVQPSDAIETITRKRDEARNAAASYKAWDFPADIQNLTIKLTEAEAERDAAIARAEKAENNAAEKDSAWREQAAHDADKIDGLEADLDSAIEVAWKHGAHEWVRLNYPKFCARITAATGEKDG